MLFPDADPVLVVPDFEESAAAAGSPIRDVRTYRDEDGPTQSVVAAILADLLRARAVRRVGIEAEGVPSSLQALLDEELPGVRFVDRTDVIDRARFVC